MEWKSFRRLDGLDCRLKSFRMVFLPVLIKILVSAMIISANLHKLLLANWFASLLIEVLIVWCLWARDTSVCKRVMCAVDIRLFRSRDRSYLSVLVHMTATAGLQQFVTFDQAP